MNKPKEIRKVGLSRKTMRKLNDGELSQAAGGYYHSSTGGADCEDCSTSGTIVVTCSRRG